MDFKGQECHGEKALKDRVTMLTYANMDGSHKLYLFDIGKFKTLRCFKDKLPVEHQSKSNAWVTAGIFTVWLQEFNKQAWEKVEPATIRNCFKKAGFQASETETEGENEIEAEDTDVQPFLSRLLVEYGIPDSLDDLENLDQDVPTAPSPSEEMNPSTTDSDSESEIEPAADDEDDQS
ncbi:tigger transposable element-derived protein 4 [Elysia marginata]|uniref:Tigger transposable element-derived protein 4 n=1 Tax=Elysia marginata TaxID=1093978 RepID=A0AAV4FVX2_9GAST|nr:tigger transposable element-derived protein 4 [Elysia marginata]